jgi:hypothetical protein
MKKLMAVLIVLLVAMSASAIPIDLGSFPTGQWLDPNYDAVWEFSPSNIRILSKTTGAVVYDFDQKTVQELRSFMDNNSPTVSFSCPESERKYNFARPLGSLDLVMTIDRTLYMPDFPIYTVTMPRQ